MGVYGIVLAGWSSNSKYSLLGGLRSAAQMISYELSYGLSLAAVIMLAGSLSLREIVDEPDRLLVARDSALVRLPAADRVLHLHDAPASPKPTARRSISRKPSRSSSPAITPNTAA